MIQMEISPQDQVLLLSAIQNQTSASDDEVYEDMSERDTPPTQQVATSVILQSEALKRPTSGLSSTYDTGRALDISKQSLSRKIFYEQVNTGTQAGMTLAAEKASCWTCFCICVKSANLTDQNKYFCSQRCLERAIGEFKACCPACGAIKPKRDCLLFDSRYYCSKQCKPAIEVVATNLANLVRDMRKADPNLGTEEILDSVFKVMTTPDKVTPHVDRSGTTAEVGLSENTRDATIIEQTPERAVCEDSRHLLQWRPSSILRDRGSSARRGDSSQRGLAKKVSFVHESEAQDENSVTEADGDHPRKSAGNGTYSKIEDLKRAKKENFHKFHDLEGFERQVAPAELKPQEIVTKNRPTGIKEIPDTDPKIVKPVEDSTQQSWNQRENLSKRLGITSTQQLDSRGSAGFTGRTGAQIVETQTANTPNMNNFIYKTAAQVSIGALQLGKPREATSGGGSMTNLPKRQLLHQRGEETGKEIAPKKVQSIQIPNKRRSSGQEVLNLGILRKQLYNQYIRIGITGEVVSLTEPKREHKDIKIRPIDVTQGKRSYSKPQSPSLQLDITPAKMAVVVEQQRPIPRSQSKDGTSITSGPNVARLPQGIHPSSLPRAPKHLSGVNAAMKSTAKEKPLDASLDQESTNHQSSMLTGPATPTTLTSKHSLPKVVHQKDSYNQSGSPTTLHATAQINGPSPQANTLAAPKYPSDFGGWQDPFPEHTEADLTDSLLVECRNRADCSPSEP